MTCVVFRLFACFVPRASVRASGRFFCLFVCRRTSSRATRTRSSSRNTLADAFNRKVFVYVFDEWSCIFVTIDHTQPPTMRSLIDTTL